MSAWSAAIVGGTLPLAMAPWGLVIAAVFSKEEVSGEGWLWCIAFACVATAVASYHIARLAGLAP